MALIKLDEPQRLSVGAASQFIRDVAQRQKDEGWKEKARKLDDLLGDPNIVIDDALPGTTDGETDPADSKTTKRIRLQKDIPLTGKDGKELQPSDPDFIKLVGILHRLADRMLGHGWIAAYGEEVSFYKAVNENFDKYFPGLTGAQADAVKQRKKDLEDNAGRKRKEALTKEPPEPPKKSKIHVDDSKEKKKKKQPNKRRR